VAIVGLGLIGGSLGLALRRELPEVEVVGVARRQEIASEAQRLGAVDRAGSSLSLLAGADLVVLACPLAVTAAVLEDSVRHLDEGARVTDVGSAKQEVVEHASRVLDVSRNPFLGGHPMAGKEVTGIANADADLFQGRPWIFTPRTGNRSGYEPSGWDDVFQAVRDIGALPAFLAPSTHDRYVAMVSHVPFLLSAAYLLSVGREDDWGPAAELASSGFRDISRLGAGDSEMYAAITTFNRQQVLVALKALRAALVGFEGALRSGHGQGLLDLLIAAREIRDTWAAEHPQLS
jgi:prephenate dehydrogenase